MSLLVAALALLVVSGFAALLANRRPALATGIGAAGAVAACAAGLWPSFAVLFNRTPERLRLSWEAPTGDLLLGIDPLSAFFLVPLFGLSALAAIYGREYLLHYQGRKWLGPPALFFNLLVASMALVIMARSTVLFLVAWEVMTLSSYLLVVFDDREPEVRRAGWVYLVAAHVGVASLIALFLLLDRHAGGLSFEAFRAMPAAGAGFSALLFALALVGFGVKAGFVPLHVWLPEAHAAAPSHVSALMSGVLIKVGLYGLLRTLTFLTPAPW
ncbi:MAG: proton-conducting transporter transmembrane domain-containing protein, partial [Myxococcaceae bacterium]